MSSRLRAPTDPLPVDGGWTVGGAFAGRRRSGAASGTRWPRRCASAGGGRVGDRRRHGITGRQRSPVGVARPDAAVVHRLGPRHRAGNAAVVGRRNGSSRRRSARLVGRDSCRFKEYLLFPVACRFWSRRGRFAASPAPRLVVGANSVDAAAFDCYLRPSWFVSW